MKPDEAGVVLDALVAAFPRYVMSAETVQLYARFLVDVKLDDAIAAVAKWIAREQRFPLISELREACANAAGDGAPDADQAFAEVLRAVAKWGAWGEPQFTHSAIRDAVNAIGWRSLCLTETGDHGTLRAHFRSAYDAAKKRRADPGHATLVAGIVRELKGRIASDEPKQLLAGKVKP